MEQPGFDENVCLDDVVYVSDRVFTIGIRMFYDTHAFDKISVAQKYTHKLFPFVIACVIELALYCSSALHTKSED